MESWSHARLAQQQQQVRLASLACDGLGHTPPHELPPLRDTPSLRSNSAMSPMVSQPTARLGELDFLCDPLRDTLRADLKTPSRLGLRTTSSAFPASAGSAQSSAAGRLGHLNVRSEFSDDGVAGYEVEQLKRQVNRLTQLRRDRDSYIQELLSEAEAAQKRYESELSRRAVKFQREVAEQLAAQQREHDLHLEERSKAHASALAQQACLHEKEIGEFRRSQRADSERRLAERLSESAGCHRDRLLRLQSTVEDMRQRLASHTAALGVAAAADGSSPSALTVAKTGIERINEEEVCEPKPEPEEGAPRDAIEEAALAERAVNEAAEAVEWLLVLARKDLERTLAVASVHVASAQEVRLQEAAKLQRELLESAARLERKGIRSRDWAAAASAAWSETLLLKVVLVWGNEVQRLRSLSVERHRVLQKRQQRQPLMLARIKEDADHWLRIVFRTWVAIAGQARREVSIEQGIEKCKDKIAQLKGQLRSKARAAVSSEMVRLQQSVLRAWASAVLIVRCRASSKDELDHAVEVWKAERASILAEAKEQATKLRQSRRAQGLLSSKERFFQCQYTVLHSWAALVAELKLKARHEKRLAELSAESTAELSRTRQRAADDATKLRQELRLQRCVQRALAVEADLQNIQNLVLWAWAAACAEAKNVRTKAEELAKRTKLLCLKRRSIGLKAIQASLEYSQRLVLRAWKAHTATVQNEAAVATQLERVATEAAVEQATARKEVEHLRSELRMQSRAQGSRLARVHTKGQLHATLFRWIVATREARREATHRHQLITAKADASAEIYKLRNELKKVALELRKQRRAHGVAAIHASLDRRLQSVLLAWATVVRDGQRESAYQRQLDIAAAESAAGCAVLRMEGRRCSLELREQRRAQALRAIELGLRYWQHLMLREWAASTVMARREALHAQQLGLAVARVEAELASQEQAAAAGQQITDVQSQDVFALTETAEPAAEVAAAALVVERLQAEREELQAQITKLHDELRRHHGSLP